MLSLLQYYSVIIINVTQLCVTLVLAGCTGLRFRMGLRFRTGLRFCMGLRFCKGLCFRTGLRFRMGLRSLVFVFVTT